MCLGSLGILILMNKSNLEELIVEMVKWVFLASAFLIIKDNIEKKIEKNGNNNGCDKNVK